MIICLPSADAKSSFIFCSYYRQCRLGFVNFETHFSVHYLFVCFQCVCFHFCLVSFFQCMNQKVRFLPDKFINKKIKKIRLFFSLEGHWKFEGKGLKGHSLLTTMHACAQMFPSKSFYSHHRFRTFYELLLHVHLAFFNRLLFVGAQFLIYFNTLFLVFELQMFKELSTFLCQLPIHFSLLRMVSLQ